jgi:hypothetical protein
MPSLVANEWVVAIVPPAILAGQAFATLGATPVDDATACLGGHPFAKSMGTRPFDSAGLKGSFHFTFPLSSYCCDTNTYVLFFRFNFSSLHGNLPMKQLE